MSHLVLASFLDMYVWLYVWKKISRLRYSNNGLQSASIYNHNIYNKLNSLKIFGLKICEKIKYFAKWTRKAHTQTLWPSKLSAIQFAKEYAEDPTCFFFQIIVFYSNWVCVMELYQINRLGKIATCLPYY